MMRASNVTQWFKSEGDAVVLLGRNREELGSSEYLAVVHHQVRGACRGSISRSSAASSGRWWRRLARVSCGRRTTSRKEVSPWRSPSVTSPARLRRRSVRGSRSRGFRPDALLFGESHARMIVSVRRRHLTRIREIARREDVPISVIGEVRGQRLEVGDLIGIDVATVRDAWRNGLSKALAGSTRA
jgi:phosphoribosylformylglycinamidine synthase